MKNCVGAPDERLEEKELRIADLEDKCESLEKENFKIRQEMNQTAKTGFGKGVGVAGGGAGGGAVRTKEETEKIISDLSKQNAVLRRKLDDAQEKLSKLQ